MQVATVDSPVNFTLFNRDSFGNPRFINDITTLTVSTPGGTVSNVSVYYNGSEVYLIQYTPRSAGVQSLLVRVNGLDVSGSPFHPMFLWPYVTVANQTNATGTGLTAGQCCHCACIMCLLLC